MRGVHFFMFLVALPLIAAACFDGYMIYLNREPEGLSTVGFVLFHYQPEAFAWLEDNTSPAMVPYFNFIFAQKTVVVGAAFAAFFYIILGVLKIIGVWPFWRDPATEGNRIDQILGRPPRGRFMYKRK